MTPGLPPMPADDAGPMSVGPDQPQQGQAPRQSGVRHALGSFGGAVGGILGTLLGWKHQEELWNKAQRVKYLAESVYSHINNPNDIQGDKEADKKANELDSLLGTDTFKNHINEIRKAKATKDLVAQRQASLAQSQPRGQAPPIMPAQQQQPPGDDAGPFSVGPPRGMPSPPVPFGNGASAAGPAPLQNEPPAMQAAAAEGGAGMGVPPPTPAPVVAPEYASQRFLSVGQQGQRAAARQLPLQQQTNALDLEHTAALSRQATALQIAEAQRKMDIIAKDPQFAKLPPLQQQEIRMRVMGVQGAVSNLTRPMNLPASAIHGSEVPEGGLTLGGAPVDPTKWYRQQQDVSSGEIRYVETTPKLTTQRVLTNKGPVLVSMDPRGEVVKVNSTVDGSPITDKAFLETIRSGMSTQRVTTVDENGDSVTKFVQTPTNSSIRKVLPGLPAPPDGTPSPRVPGNGSVPRATNVPEPMPQPLPAVIRSRAQYAKSIQAHVTKMDSLIDSLDKSGDLGVIASRWNEFKAGKIGSADPRYAALRADIGMFDSAMGVVHSTRGNAMTQHFKELADAGKMDAATLRAGFGELKDWVNTYANMGKNRPGAVDMGGAGHSMPEPPEKTYTWTGTDGKPRQGPIAKGEEADFLKAHPEAKAK